MKQRPETGDRRIPTKSFMNRALKFQSLLEVAASLIQWGCASKNALNLGAFGTPEMWEVREATLGENSRVGPVLF